MDIFLMMTQWLILLLCYAIFSCINKAVLSLSLFQTLQLKDTKGFRSQTLSRLLNQVAQFFATILILKGITVFLLIWQIIQSGISELYNFPQLGCLAILFGILFLIEFCVTIIAKNDALTVAKWLSVPILFFFYLLYPVTWIFKVFFGKKFKKQIENISLDEISEVIENTDLSQEPDQDEANLLKGVVRFSDIEAKAIMRERIMVIAIEKSTSFEKLLQILIESGYSRFPVYEGTLDNIVGVLVLKDLLPLMQGTEKKDWQSKIRPALFVEEDTKIDDLLPFFQKKKVHFAIVVDEYGGTSGIITLEDILEEITGEIVDEYDKVEKEKTGHKIDDQNWEFAANTSIIDFCKIVNLDEDFFDEANIEAESLGGLVLELMGVFPKQGAKLGFKNLNFHVLETDERRISKLLVSFDPEKNKS